MMAYKNTLIQLSLIGIIILAGGMTLSYRPTIKKEPKKDIPDAIMEQVNATIMDIEGKPKLKIITPRMKYYTEKNTSDLINPIVTLYRNTSNPWLISANFAKATQGIENVNFQDNVIIKHSADNKMPLTQIKAPQLMVHPNLQTAETSEPITLIQPNIVVNAIGMQADMKEGNIKLLSEAKGEYVPNE